MQFIVLLLVFELNHFYVVKIKNLLQAFSGLWLMEENQSVYWTDIANQLLVQKTMDAIPGRDPRTLKTKYADSGVLSDAYDEFYRVDANGNMVKDGPVQVIEIKGPLMEDDYCGSPGMRTMQQAIRAANADPTVLSIVLFNDSPGGTVAGTQNLAREIKSSKKPVVSFVNKIMASANYWIGSSASEIILDDETNGFNTLIGSIGTKAQFLDRSKEMEAKGYKLITIYADESSRKGKYADDIMNGDFTRIKNELNQINAVFLSSVKENRAGKLQLEKENVLQGDVYNGKEAIKYGLADRFGSFELAVKRSLQMAKTIK